MISPVLANMTLDGLERRLRERFPKTTIKGIAAKVNVVRYADDVRHLTQDEILLAEKRGSEEDDLWVTLPT